MGRAPCCDKANVKRGPWSPEEDDKLKSYIEEHGTGGNWIALPQKIGLKRCGKSCRLRWLNYLRPNIKHGGFTEDEDNLICSLFLSIGSRWSIIAAQLPGRTDNDIKNYWNTKLKKKLLGKQRREQSKRKCENESFCLYPWALQPTTAQSNSHLANALISPQLESNFSSYNHHISQFQSNFQYGPNVSYPETQQLSKNSSTCLGFVNVDFDNIFNGANNFQAIDEIPEEILMYNNMLPQDQLDEVLGNFSTVEMVNNSTSISTVSPESSNLNVYSSDNYEVCNQKIMSQEWTFFDEPRLLGYSL